MIWNQLIKLHVISYALNHENYHIGCLWSSKFKDKNHRYNTTETLTKNKDLTFISPWPFLLCQLSVWKFFISPCLLYEESSFTIGIECTYRFLLIPGNYGLKYATVLILSAVFLCKSSPLINGMSFKIRYQSTGAGMEE